MISNFKLGLFATIIRQGGIIAYPTETVFGLGCDPHNQQAVKRLLRLKQRSIDKGLILIAASVAQIRPYVLLEEAALATLATTPPHPITWLVEKSAFTPDWISGAHPTIAIRITQHPIAALLCRKLQSPLVSTSANLRQRPPAKSPLQLQKTFPRALDGILHGATMGHHASEIRQWSTGAVLRPFNAA